MHERPDSIHHDQVATRPDRTRWRPARRRRIRAGLVASVLAGLAGGLIAPACQSYEPRPLEPAVHRAAWSSRVLDAGALAGFVDRAARGSGPSSAAVDAADGIALREGQLVALVFNPGLRVARLRAGLAEASAEHAGRWSDPQLQFSVLRITDSVPDPWVLTPGLAFSLPLTGRLDAQRRLADAQLSAALEAVAEAEWGVWFDVRRAWVDWSAERLRIEETERLIAALEPLVSASGRLARAGELAATEANLFALEKAQRTNQLRRMGGRADAAEQRLRSLLGLAPDAPVSLVPGIDLAGDGPPPAARAPRDIETRNPTLARLASAYGAAEERLRLEVRRQWPDLTLGPMAEEDAGRTSVGLFGVIPIPIWNANRRAIAEARAGREIARAAFETELELLLGRWARAHALADALGSQRDDLEGSLVPLVDRQLGAAVELMELGEVSSLVLLDSLSRAYSTKLELIQALSGEALALAELEFLGGPPGAWGAAEVPADPPAGTPESTPETSEESR